MACISRIQLQLFKFKKYKIVLFYEVNIYFFHFNIILNITGCPLLIFILILYLIQQYNHYSVQHSLNFHISGLVSLCDKIQPQVTLACLSRLCKSGQCASSCARGSVCSFDRWRRQYSSVYLETAIHVNGIGGKGSV
jgi:hypothetical protein